MRTKICLLIFILSGSFAFAQNRDSVRRVPAIGIAISESDKKDLQAGLNTLGITIRQLQQRRDKFTAALLPDVMIYFKAVNYALTYQEFFSTKDVDSAKVLLKTGQQRGLDLLAGKAPWTTQKGEVVLGYISKIDGSVQPYGLSIPDNYVQGGAAFNLSLWFHGRGENLCEVNFIANGKGFYPKMPHMKNTIMLYPYGRYCNGFKFAGEVDVLEALNDAKKRYNVNDNGIFNRGFSMGGAAVWQFAVHYPDLWLAANPGAGFAETTEFLLLDKEIYNPTWYQAKLLHLYDCTDYAGNLANLPIIAYNGDKDLQKQAADIMEKAMKVEGLPLKRVIGANTGHAYEPAAARAVDSLLQIEAARGKRPAPKELHFVTYTLKYNKAYWLTIDGLESHWQPTRVDGLIKTQNVSLKTNNVNALSLNAEELLNLLDGSKPVKISINGEQIATISHLTKHSQLNFYLQAKKWAMGTPAPVLSKKHNLQGPIDDAFMGAFIVVRPTGVSANLLFDKWSKAEMERLLVQWRRQFRGDAIVKNDVDITEKDLSANLIVFGDRQSNKLLAKINDKLPVKWSQEQIKVGDSSYSAKDHGLIMIIPNPLNREHYLVLNSGFTFREASFLNNAKQIPMLPDWAVIDLNTPPGTVYPGKVSQAGFFDEHWKLKSPPVVKQ